MAEEAAAAFLHFDTIGLTQVAIVAQDDPLGESAYEWVTVELMRIALRPSAVKRVPRGAAPESMPQVMQRVCASQPAAVILALDGNLAQAAMSAAHDRCKAQYLVFSETGSALSAAGAASLGARTAGGLLVTQVVPQPRDPRHPLAAEYRRAAVSLEVEVGGYPSLEGYWATRVIKEAMKPCAREPSRKCLLQALSTRTFDLPGVRVQFGAAQRQPRPFVEITLLDGEGRFKR